MKTIIKGAIYTDGDVLLRPHFSGSFWMVDCTEYKTKAQIKESYDKKTAKEFINNGYFLTYEGKKYYECEYSPYHTEDFELLSDISNIEYYDEETEF
jgi:hypothetical protein